MNAPFNPGRLAQRDLALEFRVPEDLPGRIIDIFRGEILAEHHAIGTPDPGNEIPLAVRSRRYILILHRLQDVVPVAQLRHIDRIEETVLYKEGDIVLGRRDDIGVISAADLGTRLIIFGQDGKAGCLRMLRQEGRVLLLQIVVRPAEDLQLLLIRLGQTGSRRRGNDAGRSQDFVELPPRELAASDQRTEVVWPHDMLSSTI